MKLSPEVKEKICTLYAGGKSMLDIAYDLNVSRGAVRYTLQKEGVQVRPSGYNSSATRYTPEQEKAMCEEYRDGKSTPKLADEYGGSNQSIATVLKRHGIRMRPRGIKMMRHQKPEAENTKLFDVTSRCAHCGSTFGPGFVRDVARAFRQHECTAVTAAA